MTSPEMGIPAAVRKNESGVDVPSLMARSRETSSSARAPTRERVSEAIALVRARQANLKKKTSVAGITNLPELKTITGNISASKIQLAKKPTSSLSVDSVSTRSPLVPAGQTGTVESRQQPDMQKEIVDLELEKPAMSDEPEENNAPQASSFLTNPLNMIKREFQIATQSASSTRPQAASIASTKQEDGASDLDLNDSNDSDDDIQVDAKTMHDVGRFLDSMNMKFKPANERLGQSPQDAIVLDQVDSSDADPIRANRSQDFVYESEDDASQNSSMGSMNPETLAEISAFIDTVSKTGPVAPSGKGSASHKSKSMTIKTEADLAAHIDAMNDLTRAPVPVAIASVDDSEVASNIDTVSGVATEREIASYIDAVNGVKSEAEIASHIDALNKMKPEAEIASHIDAINGILTEDEIASYIDALSRSKNQAEFPSAIADPIDDDEIGNSRSKDALDVPQPVEIQQILAPSLADNAIQLREKEVMTPSYSVESLESEKQVVAAPFIGEEKKIDGDVEILRQRSTFMEVDDSAIELSVDETTDAMPIESETETRILDENNEPTVELQQSEEFELGLDAYVKAGEEAEEADTDKDEVVSTGSDLGVHWGNDPPEQKNGEQEGEDADSSNGMEAQPSVDDDDADYLLRQAFGSAEENTEVDLEGKLPELQEAATDDEADDIVTELKSTGLPAAPSINDDDESLPWDLKNIASEETMKATGRTKPSIRSKARQLKSLFSDDSSVPSMSECSHRDPTDQSSEVDHTDDESTAGTRDAQVRASTKTICDSNVGNEQILGLPSQPSGDEGESATGPQQTTHSLQQFDPFAPNEDPALSEEDGQDEDGSEDDAFVQTFLLQGSMTEDEANETLKQSNEQAVAPRDLLASSSAKSDKYSSQGLMDPPTGADGPGFLEQFDLLGFDEENREKDYIPISGLTVNEKGEPVEASEQLKKNCEPSKRVRDLSTFEGIGEYFAHLHEEMDSRRINAFQKLVSPVVDGKAPTVIEAAQIRQAAMRARVSMEVVDRFLAMAVDEQGVPDVLSSKSEFSTGAGNIDIEEMTELNEDEAISAFLARKARPPTDLTTLAGIAVHFSYLHEDCSSSDSRLMKKIEKFQKLVLPVGAGKKPTVIEAAAIRQAALGAGLSMELVDKFLDLADTTTPELPDVLSSRSEHATSTIGVDVDNIEDLDDDEQIEAFLTRFGTLTKGGHFPDANVGAVEGFIDTDSHDEEAVEVDAEFGFVNKQLEIPKSSEDDEEEQEWWKEGQNHQQRSNSDTIEQNSSHDASEDQYAKEESDRDLVELSCPDESQHVAPTPKASTSRRKQQQQQQQWEEREEVLMINTRFSTSYDDGDNEDWQRKNTMAKHGVGWQSNANWLSPRSAPSSIDGVEAASKLKYTVYTKKLFKGWYPWRRLYKQRTRFHPGFHTVDVHSVYESTAPVPPAEEEVFIPWERRRVKQRFLHEKSYSFSRNWFGDLAKKYGNQRIKQPVCKPKSMEMPIENIPDPGEWTEEWYTQWKSPYEQQRGLRPGHSDDDYTTDASQSDAGTLTSGVSSTDGRSHSVYDENSYFSGSDTGTDRTNDDDDDYSWEEAPECGLLINVKQKIGERVSRVHPDYTSSLRRSRWRKKYYPRGTFPY